MAKNATMAMSNIIQGTQLAQTIGLKKGIEKRKKQSTNYITTLSKIKTEFITQSNIKTEAIYKNN